MAVTQNIQRASFRPNLLLLPAGLTQPGTSIYNVALPGLARAVAGT